jgi:2'-5' RNA ligase/tetratricopeptide (TPR) repeat protein
MNTPVRVFCSYSREDEELYVQLKDVLTFLKRQGIIYEWHDRIISGTEWQNDIDKNLECADLIILVVSASFISSGYCSGREMAWALAQHDAGEALVTPLIARPCIWQATPLKRFSVLPKGSKAVTAWENRDQVWTQVTEGIRKAIDTPLLRPFYRELCTRGRNALLKRDIDIAPFLNDFSKDKRLGLTLIVRPSAEVATQLKAVNDQLKKLAPLHFYYDQPRFHFSILSPINATDPPKVSRDSATLFEEPIREVLSSFPSFEVEFSGVCATPSSIIAWGFPIDDVLERLRDALRERLRAAGLEGGLDERYRTQGAHITMGRFRMVEDFAPTVKFLDRMKDKPLGFMRVQRVQLVLNDFYMSPDKVQIVAEFPMTVAGSHAESSEAIVSVQAVDKALESNALKHKHLSKLAQLLTKYFDKEELRTLCFNLGVDYNDLPAEGKTNKARELVSYLERRSRIIELIEVCQQLRPDILWADPPRVTEEVPASPPPTLPPSPPTRVLHNLPSKKTNIVGREDEHAYVLEALGQAGKPVILTSGFGGIGKSALANIVAWTCVEQQRPFNFIAWIDTRRYGEAQTISLNLILDRIAKIADIHSDIPGISHLETKQDQVRALLKRYRSLLILDNYEDLLTDPEEEHKVSTFLDSLPIGPTMAEEDTCIRVLITTREVSPGLRALPIDDVRLQQLSLKDSLELLKSRTPPHVNLTDDQYEHIWELLCGLPKYMQIAADQLGSTAFEDWERITTQVEVPLDKGDRFFRDLFERSWKRFSDDFKKILMSMTYFVGEASGAALQTTSGLSRKRFTRLLESASDAYIESTGTGYTVHPLTHAFCQAVLNSANFAAFWEESGRRFAEYFLEYTRAAKAKRDFGQLEREIRNIVAAASFAEELLLWNHLIGFREAITDFLRFRSYWREQIEITLRAANACRQLRNEQGLAECLVYDLAWLFLRLEDLDNADRHINEGLALMRKLGDRKGEAQGLRHLGKSALLRGLDPWYEPDEKWEKNSVVSEEYYQESLEIREALAQEGLDQRRRIGDMKLDFGRLYWLQGKNYERVGRERQNQAIVEAALEKYEEANTVSREAKEIFEEIKDNRGIAKAWGNLGNATKEMVKWFLAEDQLNNAVQSIKEAHEYYENSLVIAVRIGRSDEISHAYWGLAEIYELYADHPDLHKRSANMQLLLEKTLEYAKESHRIYVSLGGSKDIKATDRLVNRIKSKLPLW